MIGQLAVNVEVALGRPWRGAFHKGSATGRKLLYGIET